jgi:hypothetical protein
LPLSWLEGFHQCLAICVSGHFEPKMKKMKSTGKWRDEQMMEDYTHVCIWYGIGLLHFRMQKESFHASWVMKEQGMIHSKHNIPFSFHDVEAKFLLLVWWWNVDKNGASFCEKNMMHVASLWSQGIDL